MCLGLLRQEASLDGPDDETYDRADGVVKVVALGVGSAFPFVFELA